MNPLIRALSRCKVRTELQVLQMHLRLLSSIRSMLITCLLKLVQYILFYSKFISFKTWHSVVKVQLDSQNVFQTPSPNSERRSCDILKCSQFGMRRNFERPFSNLANFRTWRSLLLIFILHNQKNKYLTWRFDQRSSSEEGLDVETSSCQMRYLFYGCVLIWK